jgi:nucleotide-binding universal stress UspA family protein
MLHVRTVLFPVDFSRRCSIVAPYVSALTNHFHAKLIIVHAMEISPPWYVGLAPAEVESTMDTTELVTDRRRTLDEYLQYELQGLRQIQKIVEIGEPAMVISEYARKEHVDLIMMPTHGHGPFRRLLLGSVTAKVLHDAECPVWTDVHEEKPVRQPRCQAVICAVDCRQEAITSIQWAADFADSFGAQLTLIHAIPALAGAPDCRFRKHLVDYSYSYIDDLQRKTGTDGSVLIEGGKIAQTVRNAALQLAADLVVIGQGCLHETLGGLRSNAYVIVRKSPCPVVRV